MGVLSRIGLAEIVREHRLDTLVETGTGHGHSLLAALQVPELVDLRSIEIDFETWHRHRVGFAAEPRVTLYHGDSVEVLPRIAAELATLNRRVLWFLDAHFAGSGRLDPVPMIVDEGEEQVPLVREFEALRAWRDLWRDVLIVDDLCLFEPGNYEADAPDLRAALGGHALDWIDAALCESHEVTRSTRDGGYLIARPRQRA